MAGGVSANVNKGPLQKTSKSLVVWEVGCIESKAGQSRLSSCCVGS